VIHLLFGKIGTYDNKTLENTEEEDNSELYPETIEPKRITFFNILMYCDKNKKKNSICGSTFKYHTKFLKSSFENFSDFYKN